MIICQMPDHRLEQVQPVCGGHLEGNEFALSADAVPRSLFAIC